MSADDLKPPFERPLTSNELAALADEDIDYSDIPELDDEFWEKAVAVYPPTDRPSKKQTTLRLDPDILAYFRRDGRGYQTRINAVLRAYVDRATELEQERANAKS